MGVKTTLDSSVLNRIGGSFFFFFFKEIFRLPQSLLKPLNDFPTPFIRHLRASHSDAAAGKDFCDLTTLVDVYNNRAFYL